MSTVAPTIAAPPVERPIHFGAVMVRAILAGRKTQMRQVVKPGRGQQECLTPGVIDMVQTFAQTEGCPEWWTMAVGWKGDPARGHIGSIRCPFGAPGDRLWVKEAFWCEHDSDWSEASGRTLDCGVNLAEDGDLGLDVQYPATPENREDPRAGSYLGPTCQDDGSAWPKGEDPGVWCAWDDNDKPYGSYPAISMPRWAARILLEVTAVRIERLQAMMHGQWDEVQADGMTVKVDSTGAYACSYGYDGVQTNRTPWAAFARRWDQTYPRYDSVLQRPAHQYAWERNPYVWVVDFRVVNEAPEGAEDE